jgi:hypothetical protein
MLTPHATANSLQIRAKARPQTITRPTGRTRGSAQRLKDHLWKQITCTFTSSIIFIYNMLQTANKILLTYVSNTPNIRSASKPLDRFDG